MSESTILYEPWTIDVDDKGAVSVKPEISGGTRCGLRVRDGKLCYCCDTPTGEVCYVCSAGIAIEG